MNDQATHALDPSEWMQQYEGMLAIDVYETTTEIIVMAPLAGVAERDISVSITNDHLVIEGERPGPSPVGLLTCHEQECYWGKFHRDYTFPVTIDSHRASARLIEGILTIKAPKLSNSERRSLAITS
jgi:HSP20 family protein